MVLKRAFPLLVVVSMACSAPKTASAPLAGSFTLLGEANDPQPLDQLLARSPHSVFLFFTSDCPVQKAHDERMRATVAKYKDKGVAFYAVQSEAGTDIAAERAEAQRRQIGMPLLQDKGGAFADALGVEYSTHVVLLESNRAIRYSGAEDSERVHTGGGVTPYLEQALDAVLAGKDPPVARAEPLGCPLRKH
ncbi:MAG: redoxin domain-containing protein [Labilithrix sp.]